MWGFSGKKTKSKFCGDYIFTPQTDITALEIARFLEVCNRPISAGATSKLSPEIKRHFVKIEE